MKNLLLKKVEKNCIILITLLIGSFGYAQIAQRGTATTATSSNTTLTINKPTGLAVNDLMIVNLAQGNNNTNAPTATGWTLIDGRSLAGGTKRYAAVLYKIANATDVSASNFVFTMGSATDSAAGAIIAFSGVDSSTPFDVSSGTISVQGSQTGVVGTTKTTVTANAAVIMLGQTAGSFPTWSAWTTTSPGALTELFDVQHNANTQTSVGGAWAIKASTGATSAGGATLSSAERNGGILLVLRPCINTITLSSAVGTDAQTKCINSAITDITYTTTGATGASISGLPTGVTGAWASNVYTINGTPSVAGTYNYTITLTGGCGPTVTKTGSITVTALPTATISYAGSPYCTSLASAQSVTQTGTGGGTYSASPAGLTLNAASGAVTPSTSSAGTYTVTYTLSTGGCTITPTASVTITALPVATISYAGNPFCKSLGTAQSVTQTGTAGGTYSASPAGLTLNASTGAVTPSTSTSGTFTVTYTIAAASGCGIVTTTTSVTITTIPTAAISYAGSPYCTSLASTQSVTQTGTGGGTYSASPAGLTLNAASGAVTPSTSTAGTYTVTYTLSTGGCTITPTASVTITALPVATISYAGNPFCKSLGTAQSVTQTGTTGGTYSASPAGLTLNASTGAVTPSTSTAGTFTVTYTIAAASGCGIVTTTTSVTITTIPTAAISYAGSPYCTSLASAQSVTQTGTGGGTYSASPAGLTLNAASGAVTPSTSTAGTYTVTYTLSTGGCTITPTASVTITALPTATISYAGSPFCKSLGTAQSVTQTGTAGGTYSASPAGLTLNAANGDVTPSTSTAGTYTVTYTIAAASGCGIVTTTASVTITTIPTAAISYAGSPYCKSLASAQSVTQTGTGGGTYSASPAGLTLNAASGAVTPSTSTAGTYTVTYTLSTGGCTITPTASVTITALPVATISYAGSPFCKSLGTAQSVTQTGTAGGTYSASPAGLTLNASTGAVTPSTSTAGTFTVTYTIAAASGCGIVTTTASVTITTIPTAAISYAGSPYCTSLASAQSVTQTGTGGGTYSASPAGLTLNAASGAVTPSTSTAGTYTVTYTLSTGGCTITPTASVTITALPVATISYAGNPFCKSLGTAQSVTQTGTTGGTYSASPAGLTLNASTGAVTPSTSTAGTYTVTYTIAAASGCGIVTTTTSVTITTIPTAAISYAGSPYCTSLASAQSVTQTGTGGGTYSASPAGLTLNAASGAVTPSTSTAGTYTVTYTLSTGGCTITPTASVTITALPTATISYAGSPFCKSLGTAQSVTQTGTAGGTYSASPAGLTLNAANGDVTPSTSTAGTYTVTYTIAAASGCGIVTTTASVTITTIPTAAISYAGSPYCKSLASAQSVTQTGTGGGTYSASPSGLTLNAASGAVTPSTSTAGTYTVTYTLSTGGCTITPTASVTITALPVATISYAGSPFCKSLGTAQSVTQTGTAGGTYSASPAGLTLNAANGDVTPSTSTAGTYTVTYTIAAASGCGIVTTTAPVTITTIPTAAISYAGSPYCKSLASAQSVTRTGTAGGTYSASPAGLTLNAGTGAVTPSTSTAGTYTVTYTLSTGGCTITPTASVTITAIPVATISYTGSPFCKSLGTAQSVTQTGTTGGTYSASPAGLTLNAANGDVTPSTSTAGTYTVTYTIAAASGCGIVTTTASVTITTIPTAAISYAGNPFCKSIATAQSVTQTGTAGGTYSASPAGLTINAASGAVTPSTSTAGSYTVTYTLSTGGCTITPTTSVTINPILTAGVTIAASPSGTICAGTSVTFTATPTNGGTTPTYQWKINGTNVLGEIASTFTTSTLSNTNVVTVVMTSNATPCLAGSPVTSSGITMAVDTMPSITSTTPASRTGTGTLTLGATASIGTISWYANITGGPSLGSGTSFTTPSISTTTIYYVEAVNGACTSTPRTPVTATINYAEIDIQGNATSIVDGDTTPTTTDWTDFGTSATTRTFTIYNTGASALNIGTATISGLNASEFTITSAPSSVVGIGSSTTFTITFDPTAVGLRTATISIVNNDTNENPYDFAIQGTGVEQEIDIQGNAVSIVNGDTTPTTTDWTDFSTVAGTRTFTIRNTGNIVLNIGAITVSGLNASDFTVTSLPSATVAAFGTTTFTVSFSPSVINNRTATISIANDDATENPYAFSIQGFGIIPEIDIQGNATSIVDGDITPTTTDWTDFSSVASTRTFTIYNNGNFTLNIGAITIGGPNASEFTVTTLPSATVAALASTTFVVTFSPTALGTRSATISIINNDSNEDPYNFSIQGTGVVQEIDLQGLSISIVDGDTVPSVSDGTDFGPADINLATVTRTFSILNTGSLPLTISNPTISGLNAADFSISTNPGALSIAAGSSTTFVVTFNPSGVFTRVATINIVNNDSSENPYDFAIQGTGLLDNDGDGIENNTDQDDDNDGIIDIVECGTCISDPFVNGSFEAPVIGASTYSIEPAANVTGWNNSAENFIEIWSTGFNGVPSAAGNQFAELNANVAGNLYQTFCLNGAGGTINWAIKHRGRSGTDVAEVRFGATLATIATVATMTDGNTSWGSYSGTYSIPVGQTSIVLAFTAVSSTGGLSYGNFIDDVQIIINQNCIDSDADGVADLLDVDDENDGIPDIEEAGFKAYSSNKSVMDRSSAATWVDANSNGLNDYIETMITAGTYSTPDTDGDGVKDYLDLDSDNDTAFDVDEAGILNGDGDINGDGKGDGLDSDGDGLLNLYDNSTVFGTTTRAYAQDTDTNGTPDYKDLDSNDDGVNDIKAGLYGSYDANNDGRIDTPGDADLDGITDAFDTNDAVKGSPRDLDRKLFLDFDGRNDYAENTAILGGLSNATLMAWIDLNSAFSTTGVVVGQDKFQIRVSSAKTLQVIVNSTTLTFATPMTTSRWYHVAATYGGGNLNLYLNGKLVATQAVSGSISADATKLTLGKNPASSTNYFKGKIDEVRVFNTTLTNTQVERMVYQEIQNTASQVRGAIVPRDMAHYLLQTY
ncbi:choice-of-anchor D domain-containing protein [Flavobacterium paronense]|uniref:choice-of-anchor D domain-containing protein n=1 Tax=Flavobacterium paronense TaxID=1392775 RepID=UPI0025B52ADA|nr:choice-of-anchor D domain-containing protein [Flavobacterium paronense]MDN3675839.1 choice-of-anchor D domain-containing protein [Flavobacterium paronense]